MTSSLRPAVVLLAAFTLLTGVLYPAAITLAAQGLFPRQAGGSLIAGGRDGQPLGSRLIGQSFDEPRYFWGRLSATGPFPYNAGASAASNLGPSNPKLRAQAEARLAALRAADPNNPELVPVELVTASASGLDPHLGPAGARFQIKRVARARGLDEQVVSALVDAHTQGRWLGIIGEPVVDVLGLNRALDARTETAPPLGPASPSRP
jgi:K+-transporting ATPase ATPase C chain